MIASPAEILYLVRLDRIELDVFREFRWKICFRVDRVHRTYVYACHAIDAFIRMNDQLGVHFRSSATGTPLQSVNLHPSHLSVTTWAMGLGG